MSDSDDESMNVSTHESDDDHESMNLSTHESDDDDDDSSDDSDDPGDTLETIQSPKLVENKAKESMSLKEKVDHLHQEYPGFPPVMIRRVLRRDDVNEDLEAATNCLEDMKGIADSKENRPQGGKAWENAPKGNASKTDQGDTDTSPSEPLNLEEKVKYLQKSFKNVAPFLIRKVLNCPEVNEDLELAKARLEENASKKSPAKADPEPNRSNYQDRGWRGGSRGRARGRPSGANRGRRQCWEAGTSNQPDNNNFDQKDETWSCNSNQNNENKNKNRRNRNRNRQQQNQGGGDRRGGYYRGGGANQGGTDFQHGMHGYYNSMPYDAGPFFGGPPHQSFDPNFNPYLPQQFQNTPNMGFAQGFNQGNYRGGRGMPTHPQQFPNASNTANNNFAQGFNQRNNEGYRQDGRRQAQRGNRGMPTYNQRPQPPQQFPNASNTANSDFAQGFNQRNNEGSRQDGGRQAQSGSRDTPRTQPMETNTIVMHGLSEETTFDGVRNFIEARTQEEVCDVALFDDNKSAIITLKNLSDFNKAKQRVLERKLDGSTVSIECVPVCSSIMVSGLSPNTTPDGLEFYFSARRIGGDVSDVKLEDDHAIVTFQNPNVINKVINPSSPHVLDGATLKVCKDYPFLHKDTNRNRNSRDDIVIVVDPNIMAFIMASHHIEDLKKSLLQLKFTLEYKPGDNFASIIANTAKPASKEKGIKAMTDFVRRFTTFKLNIDSKHKEVAIADIYELQQDLGKDKLLLVENKDSVLIVCLDNDSENLKKRFTDQLEETKKPETKKTFQNQTILIDEDRMELLTKFDFVNNHLSKEEYPELQVQLNEEEGTITIVGPKEQFSEAKIKLYQHLAKIREREVSLSNTIVEILSSEEGKSQIKRLLEENNIYAVFCVEEGDAEHTTRTLVIGLSNKDADDAAQLISKRTTEVKIKVDKDNQLVLKSQQWQTLCDLLKANFNVYIRRDQYLITWIAGFDDDVSNAHDMMKTFLDQKSLKTEVFVCQDNGVRRYLLENRKEEIKNIVSTLVQYSVQVKPALNNTDLWIYGSKVGIKRAHKALHIIVSSVTKKEVKIQQPGLDKLFTSGRGDRIVKSIEHDHHCTILPLAQATSTRKGSPTDSPDESTDDSGVEEIVTFRSRVPALASVNGQSVQYGNVSVSWKAGNIVNEKVDVLVGSIQGVLAKSFQVRKCLYRAMNPGTIRRVNLFCGDVILTNCTGWGYGNGKHILQSTVQQCLQEALQMNAQSIAFPILGSKGYGKNKACRIMINEVINVVSGWRGMQCVNDVRFVVYDKDQQLITAFQQEFNAATDTSFFCTSSSAGLPGNVTISVVPGDLVQEGTDAIVNFIGTDMNLHTAGKLSEKIAIASPAVQTELTNAGQRPDGAIVITSAGGRLRCNNILNVVSVPTTKANAQAAIENCLKTADNQGYHSISLPAFVTGKANMTAVDSAQATFTAITNVYQQLHSLQQIKIVIYQDANMQATFQQIKQQYGLGSGPHKISERKASSRKSMLHSRQPTLQPKPSVSRWSFAIYSKSTASVETAATSLIKSFSESCKRQEVENEGISKLSDRQRSILRTKANKLDVTIKFEDKIGRIVVSGDPDDVTTMINDVWAEIQEKSKKDKDSEQSDVLSKTVRWQYELNGQTVFFTKGVNAAIEKAQVNKERNVMIEIQGEKLVVDLINCTGREPSTGRTVTITRTTVGTTKTGDIYLPKEWNPMPMVNGKEATVHLVPLTPASIEYQRVLTNFQSTGGTGHIIKIERIQNPHLYEQYMVHKKKMDKENVGINNERELFHGTAEKNINDINKWNFNRSFCGAHGDEYGKGVYFARDASFSMRYFKSSGHHRYMYLARVLVGRYTTGHPGLIAPPVDPHTFRYYDSVANAEGSSASVFVTFYDTQCYPEYLITFQ